MFPIPTPTGGRLPPQRVDSLISSKTAVFTQVEEELRDVRRVHAQGQEEDLRMALSQMINRVQELVRCMPLYDDSHDDDQIARRFA